MIFAAPALLLALLLLPALLWLLRATPPAPRNQAFPALRLLRDLAPTEETPARTPPWLLALRLAAAALLIVGLAGPALAPPGGALPPGPVILVLDDGFAAAPDWSARLAAAQSVLERAERAGRKAILVTTAPDASGLGPAASPALPALALRPMLAARRPLPWAEDRAAAARVVAGLPDGPVFYLQDGAGGVGDAALSAVLSRRPVTVLRGAAPALLLAARAEPDRLVARLRVPPGGAGWRADVVAQGAGGAVLARVPVNVAPGQEAGEAAIPLPVELRNQVTRLSLAERPGAGGVALIDESARRRPVGLVAGGASSELPLLGPLFYLDRALDRAAELRRGTVEALLARPIAVLAMPDRVLSGPVAERLAAWVRQGGFLVRFAGPTLAASPGSDALLPAPLLTGDRQLGGTMSWSHPEHLAAFPAGSPFAGLAVPEEVTVDRQVLAAPGPELAGRTWAALRDGTPLVTAAPLGRGEVVLFHVTSNADWSNLPLSGLFVSMMQRLVRRAAGVAAGEDARLLEPAEALDGEGVLGPPGRAARPISAPALASTVPSPAHPPGFYGPENDRHALNLGASPLALRAPAAVPGAAVLPLSEAPSLRPLGAGLVAVALGLLLADLLIALGLRGLLRPAVAGLLVLGVAAGGAWAAELSPALSTHLAYVRTGDAAVDERSCAGLEGLSDYVNGRTAAALAEPAAVSPGEDDLSFYPLLYWPITDAVPAPAAIAAMNDYMRHGGIILIDTQGGGADAAGSGAGMAPDAGARLKRATKGLDVPALAPLGTDHVLARAFYLLDDFPGRYDGDTVWVQQDQDRSNDSVSSVILGTNDWAGAWASDADGRPLYAVLPGGDRQRTLAYRFGVNLVMYALTGNYKGDQVHVPAILERLGQ